MPHQQLIDDVTEFIDRRFGNFPKEYWNSGNCYYFSIILCERFSYLRIYYDPIEGHFYAGYEDCFFDVAGYKSRSEFSSIVPLVEIALDDPLWYERLWEDCVK